MISQIQKKIYLIGTNPFDYSDCTIEALTRISQSETLILSRNIYEEFSKMINFKKKKIIFDEDISNYNDYKLWKEILKLFEKNKKIAHLLTGDPFLEAKGYEEKVFFTKNKIKCELIPGVINIVNFLNNNMDLLTNREKNSSVTFLKPFNIKKISKIISKFYFEKLIVNIKSKDELNYLNSLLNKDSLNKKFYVKLVTNNSYKKIDTIDTNLVENFSIPTYIIIETHE